MRLFSTIFSCLTQLSLWVVIGSLLRRIDSSGAKQNTLPCTKYFVICSTKGKYTTGRLIRGAKEKVLAVLPVSKQLPDVSLASRQN
jgi:hypothetical protein